MDKDEIRVKIADEKQRELFLKFIKDFKKHKHAAEFLGLSKYNLSDYLHCKTRDIPKKILEKICKKLNCSMPKIQDEKTLKQIRQQLVLKATIASEKKFGVDRNKIFHENSKRGLYKKYRKDAYKIITRKGHATSEKRYGKNWRKVLSQKGIEALKQKYGEEWHKIPLTKGRKKLEEKYGSKWQKELSKLAMKSLHKKHVINFDKRFTNLRGLFNGRDSTNTEKFIANHLKEKGIKFKTNIIKNNLEFDIVIPDENNPKYVIEVSDIKPTTYNQRKKILQLYFQKLNFPDAQHIAILRTFSFANNKKHTLHHTTKLFFDEEGVILLSLENIEDNINQLAKCIKNNKKINLKEDFSFSKKAISSSRKGCITQSKKSNEDEIKLNSFLLDIGAIAKGAHLIEVKDKAFICLDNFEIYENTKIAYEITSSNSYNVLRSLAGKILLCKKFNKDLKFVAILNNPKIFNNSSLIF